MGKRIGGGDARESNEMNNEGGNAKSVSITGVAEGDAKRNPFLTSITF